MTETPVTYATVPDDDHAAALALLLTARDEMGKRIEAKDAALRRCLWCLEDFEITGIIDRVEVQATLRELKAALKR